ncbi:MAG: hypothetical protein ACYTGH_01440 [Planctomycetota bacterium]|jgi:hypothetical protein
MKVVHDFLEDEPERVIEDERASKSIRIKRSTCELNFSYRHLILQFRYACTLLKIDEEGIAAMLEPARLQAKEAVRRLVLEKWLPTVIGEERFSELDEEQCNAAADNYMKRYAKRVEAVFNAIRFEALMKKTLSLCKKAVDESTNAHPVDMKALRAETAFRAVRRLRELYGSEIPKSTGDKELIELYNHDFVKLVTLGQIDSLVEACHC